MAKPKPEGGLVIRYDYLWSDEARDGREEGAKDRPCAVVVVARHRSATGGERAYICAITHREPEAPTEGIEIPAALKKLLRLDGERSWVITSEVNLVDWSDPGIVPVPETGNWSYGTFGPRLTAQVNAAVVAKAAELPVIDRPRIEAARAEREAGEEAERDG